MKRHKSLSNILVILCGQGLCWPLWATMLLGVQSSFHLTKSLSCVTMPPYTSLFIYCVHSLLMPTFSGDVCSAMKLPVPFAPFCQAPLLWSNADDDSVPMLGPVTVTRMGRGGGCQEDNAVVYWWVKGHVWSDEGPLPGWSHHHRQTSGKLLWSQSRVGWMKLKLE